MKMKRKRSVILKGEEENNMSPQSCSVEETDFIGDLPDSILCHILSFLPTKTSVATSVLSRRWRHVWEHLQAFQFSSDQSLKDSRFAAFVDHVLARRRVPHIQRFRLKTDIADGDAVPVDPRFAAFIGRSRVPQIQKPRRLKPEITDGDAVADWVRSAVGPQLHELGLYLRVFDPAFCCKFPHSIFTCSALVILTLSGRILCPPLSSFRFPSLKYLVLQYLLVESTDDNFLSGCPVLKTLWVWQLENVRGPHRRISIHVPPWVKRLTIFCPCVEELEFGTPSSLEYLYFTRPLLSRLSCSGDLHNLVEACIAGFNEGDLMSNKLLSALHKVKILVLLSSTVEPPLRAFPEFCGLTSLELIGKYVNLRFLIDLLDALHKCPMLQVLKIDKGKLLDTSECSDWTLPDTVPKCLMLELTTFEFRGYQDFAVEHALVAYILQRGLVLKTVKIRTRFCKEDVRLNLKKLSDIPRGSNMCKLKFR